MEIENLILDKFLDKKNLRLVLFFPLLFFINTNKINTRLLQLLLNLITIEPFLVF